MNPWLGSPTAVITARVLYVVDNYQLARLETSEGQRYCVTPDSAGIPWNALVPGNVVRCVVTTDLPRVAEVLEVLNT